MRSVHHDEQIDGICLDGGLILSDQAKPANKDHLKTGQ
jgi:hypothetical protein